MSQNTALTELYCYDNQLSSLDVSHNTALTDLYCSSNQLMSLDLSKCTKLTHISFSFQSKSVIASSLGSNQYRFDVPSDFNLSKVSSFTVNSVSVTPTLSNGKLQFTSSTVPTSVTYQYNTDNSAAGNMKVKVTITSVEDASEDVDESGVVLDATNFPDAKFRAYISNRTGVEEGGTLSEEKLKSVTYIDVSGYYSANGGITSLKGVEYFTALTNLSCNYNLLTGLDVSQNTALAMLYCYDNKLTSLDVSQNTALTVLHCGNNQLTSLDVSQNTALIELTCYSNQLSSLDVSQNTALTELHCSSNQLSSLDVSHNTALTTLYCNYNQLSSLDVSHNTALTALNCEGNQLTSLDVSHNTALTELHCGVNQLTSLDVSQNTALTSLYCGTNQLTSLDVSHNTVLKYLYCYSNQLMNLDLSKCTKLKSGYTSVSSQSKTVGASSLGSNQYIIDVPADFNLSKVSSFTVNSVSVTPTLSEGKLQFTSTSVPTSVSYEYNTDNSAAGNMKVKVTITSVEDESEDVVVLDATNFPDPIFRNCISGITGVAEGGTLSKEILNSVTRIDVGEPDKQNLRQNWTYKGEIKSLKGIEYFKNLTHLICFNNKLTDLDVSQNTALQCLICYENKLTSLDLSKNTELIQLECYRNKLMCLDLNNCTKLTTTTIAEQFNRKAISSLGSDQYSIDVPAGFDLSKVSSFKVNYVDVTPTLSNGKLFFTSTSVPDDISYNYDSASSIAGEMNVRVDILNGVETEIELNYTNFPDGNFLATLSAIWHLPIGDTFVPERVTHLNLHGDYLDFWSSPGEGRGTISNLQGIEFFTALEELDCSYNSLTSLDVSQNAALTRLDCSDNQLPSLDVSHNTELTSLNCGYNQLTSLDVSKNSVLKELVCRNNQLTKLVASGCTALERLELNDNPQMTLDLSGCTALTELDYDGQLLTSLNVSGCTSLTMLSCNNSQLKSLDISNCTALTRLSCNDNQLASLDISSCTALTMLSCNNNQLISLDNSGCTTLTDLLCSNNQLTNLDLSGASSLIVLNCSGNQLMCLDTSNCPDLSFSTHPDGLGECPPPIVSPQKLALSATSVGINKYIIPVPADFNLSKVSSFKVNTVSVTPTLSNGNLQFSSSSVPTSVTYEYDTSNRNARNMSVTVDITSIESGVVLNATNFPDDTFRSYISGLTGVAEGGKLSEENLKSVTSIDVSGSSSANGGITNLKGVEYFTALTTLKCAYNLLTTLDVSQNTALTRLECNSNQLTSLDVSKNAALTTLACDENQLPSLDVSQNPALTELRCSYNLLSSLEVSQNTALTELGCDRNQLSSLDLSQNTALTKLYCSDNQLTSLDLSQNTALTTLSCGDNQLWDLDLSQNTALTELDCWGNQLTSLDVSQNTALTSLGCVSNQLTSLDLSQNTELSALECYGNLLMNLDLSNCTKLTYSLVSSQATSVVASSLGSNQYCIDVPADFDLSKVSSFTVNAVSVSPTLSDGKLLFTSVSVPTSVSYEYNTDNSVAGNMEVTVTITSFEDESGVVLNSVNFPDAKFRAYISSVTGVAEGGILTEAKLTSVTSIDVSGNASANGGITRLKGVEHFTALTTLKCAYNKLSSLDLSQNTALNYLYCNNNQLSSLDVSPNTALTELDCSSNQLTGLDVSKNAALTELECSSNQLTSLDVSQNAALTELECNSNQLTGIDVSMNTALKTLSCYSNQLMNLDLSKCTKLSAASVSSQSKPVVASSWGSNQYSIDVPADFNLSKVTSFKVNSVSVIPTLSNGKLLFITSSVPTSVSYEYNTDNNVAGSMSVTVDITAVEDAAPANTVYMDDMEVMTGMEETLSVKMKNEVPMVGFEFDLYVPEGVTVATDGDGFPEVYLSTERTTARKTNSFDAIFLPDGGVRVQATSTNGSAFSGNDGEVVTVKVNIGADMAEGDYTVLLKNIVLSGTDAVSYPTEQMSSTLHVTSGTLGDANRDKCVDVADFTTTAHYILGKNPDPFNDLAADANRDESIDMNDLTAIAHIILYGSVDKPASWANGLPRRAPAAADGTENGEGYPWTYVYVDTLTVESGTEQTLSLKMKNAEDAEGFEFDLYLPDGMSFVLDADGFPETNLSTERTTTRKTNSFDAVILPDGGLRVLAASTNASAISGHDGEVAQVKVRIDSDVPTGTYLLTLKEIAVSDVDCVSHRTDELVSGITVVSREPTSLRNVETDGDADNTYYNMSGQRINKPSRSGVYIQRGKKVVVK